MMVDSITGEFPVSSFQFLVGRKQETRNQELETNYGRFDACRAEQLSLRCLLGLAFSLAFLFSGPSFVLAQPLQKTVAMIGARSGASWPLWIAKDAGLYAKYGLDVELVYAVHPAPIAAVISGQAAMTSSGSDPALLAASKDPSLVVLGGFMNKGSFAMIGSKTTTDMKQLAGKKVGIGRVGDPPYHMAASLLKKYGMTTRDVQWVSIGVDAATRAAALQSGQVDAALITAPAYFRLQTAGLPVLAVLLDHDDIYVSTYYLFRRDALTRERSMALAFIKAHAEAIKRFYDDKSLATRIMIKYGGARSVEDANQVYELFRKARVLEAIPYALKGSVDAVVERQGQELKGGDLSKMIDNSLVDQLMREKFFETTFGASIREEQQRKQSEAFGR
jgi:ABC-type nitrate/sulfonate/bicarbonate transport system substrate-binding protein